MYAALRFFKPGVYVVLAAVLAAALLGSLAWREWTTSQQVAAQTARGIVWSNVVVVGGR